MIVFRFIHTIFFYLVVVVSFFIGTTITLLFVPFSRSKNSPFQIAARLWGRFLIPFSGLKVTVAGVENIPKDQPLIIAANHQGAADILIVLAYLPVYFRFAIKKELFAIPAFGWYLKQAGYFPVDRQMILSAYKMVEKIEEIIKAGNSVLIFPEGTRSYDGSLGKFKRGSLLAAQKANVPVLPVAISGSFNIMPRGTWLFNACPVKLSIGQPVSFTSEADFDKNVEQVRQTIADLL